jgi:hypothetical protein
VVLLAGLLGLGLLGLLALNTVLTQGSFATSDLSTKQAALSEQEQQLQQEVARLQSPQQLAAAAIALGMVGTHNPVFIDTRTGRVLGVPQAAPPRPARHRQRRRSRPHSPRPSRRRDPAPGPRPPHTRPRRLRGDRPATASPDGLQRVVVARNRHAVGRRTHDRRPTRR